MEGSRGAGEGRRGWNCAGYSVARQGKSNVATLGGVLDYYESSGEFTRCSESTKIERARVLASMKKDILKIGDRESLLCDFPTAALAAKKARSIFKLWRDAQAAQRGPRAADYRVQTLKRALNIAVPDGIAPANPLNGMAEIDASDRSDLIWEEEHQKAYFGLVAQKRAEILAKPPPTNKVDARNRKRALARLQAGEDALAIALWSGMRRGDLAAFDKRAVHEHGVVYTALKGSRRARTAGRKSRVCVIPILPPLRAVLDRRLAEGRGWIITTESGARYKATALGRIVSDLATEAGVDRTMHDAKGNFVLHLRVNGFSKKETAEIVDWSEDDVERIERKYASGDRIAQGWLARFAERSKTD